MFQFSKSRRFNTISAYTVIFALLLQVLALVLIPVQQTYAAVYTVEGESPKSSNFKLGTAATTAVSYTGASGGSIWKLETGSAMPEGGYIAQYQVNVPTEGLYQFDVITTPVNATWASPYEISINGADYFSVTAAASSSQAYAQVGASLYKYHLAPVSLNAGINSVSFRVTQKRTLDNSLYVFYLDSLSLTNTTVAKPDASPLAGQVTAGTAISLWDSTIGAEIYYTVDGTDPLSSSTRQKYSSPVAVNASMTIKAAASIAGYTSEVTSFAYTTTQDTIVNVEGEAPATTNFKTAAAASAPTVYAGASGGRIYRLETNSALPAGGYYATYQVQVPEAGVYSMNFISTPLDVTWASNEFYLSINGGTDIVVNGTAAVKGSALGAQLYRYALNQEVLLNQGMNTVTFKVTKTRQSDANYILYLDSFKFSEFRVSSPTASPSEGTITVGSSVQLTTATSGAAIYYTTDGSDPKISSSRIRYTQPVPVSSNMTIKCIAEYLGIYSDPATCRYTVTEQLIISTEGEAYTSTNFLRTNAATPISVRQTASGGKILQLETGAAIPEGGFVTEYTVTVPAQGLYQLTAICTPLDVRWASPISIQANDSVYIPLTTATKLASIDDQLMKFDLTDVYLNEGVNTLRFKVDAPRPMDSTKVFYLDAFSLTPTTMDIASVTSNAPLNVFQEGETVAVDVNLNYWALQDYPLQYTVTDYFGNIADQGTAVILQGGKSCPLTLNLTKKGHFTVKAEIPALGVSKEEFLSVVVPYSQRQVPQDSPFAIDTASSWYVPAGQIEDYATAIQLSGAKWIRERFSWSSVEPTNDSFSFTSYDTHINTLSSKGLKLLDLFVGTPAWAKTGTSEKLAGNLLDVYNFAKTTATHYGSKVGMWEIWNEEEAYETGNNESADQFAAFLKAAAIGFRDAEVAESEKAGVAMGGFIKDLNKYGPYQQLALQNEILTYSDIYNFHNHQPTYDPQAPINDFLSNYTTAHLAQRDAYNGGNTPAWVSEAGLGVKITPPLDFTRKQQADQARYLVTSTVEDLSLGVSKHFWFVGINLQEAAVNWGTFSRNMTPYACYSAEAAMSDALGEGKYTGKISGLPQAASGYAFKDGNDSVLVLWSETPAQVSLNLGQPSAVKTDIMGNRETVSAENGIFQINLGVDPVYIRIQGDVSSEILQVGAEKPELVKKSLNPAQRIVLAQRYSDEARLNAHMNNAYTLKLGMENNISLDVYNFNSTAMDGVINGISENGWTVSEAQNIHLEPFEKKTLTFTASSQTQNIGEAEVSQISFRGEFGNQQTSVSTANIKAEKSVLVSTSIQPDGTKVLKVEIKNPSTEALTLQSIDWSMNGAQGSTVYNVQLPGASSSSVYIEGLPEVNLYDSYAYQVKIYLSGGFQITDTGKVSFNSALKQTIEPDGQLDSLNNAASIDLIKHGTVTTSLVDVVFSGPQDLSGNIWTTWDETNFYLSAKIIDDTFSQNFTGTDIWQGDAIQFAVAQGPAGAKTSWYEYGMALTQEGPKLYRWIAPTGVAKGYVTNVDLNITRTESEKTTLYELAIPWTELTPVQPADGEMSFSVLAADNDGSGREGWIEWGGGIGNSKDPALFKTLQLYDGVPLISAVTGVSLNKSSLDMKAGQSESLTAEVLPADATNRKVTRSTSNSAIAVVDSNGTVTAVSPGVTDITAATSDGGYMAVCRVEVINGERVWTKLQDSNGTGISGGIVSAYIGGQWKSMGTTDEAGRLGIVVPEGTANLTVGMKYGGTYNQITQNITTENEFAFSTKKITVDLKDSAGNALVGGTATYYADGWKSIGTTDQNGQASIELLPGNYSFGMKYLGTYKQLQQDTAANANVEFGTVKVTVSLKDSSGNSLTGGIATYYADGWKSIGTTDENGQVGIELLPGNYSFGMKYLGAYKQLQQNTAATANVEFVY